LRDQGLLGLVDRRHGPRIVAPPRPTQLSLPIRPVHPVAIRPEPGPRRPGKRPHPLVKWSGSKAAIAGRLAVLAPSAYHAYHEPFVGGGALFFRLRPARAFLSDLNAELTNLYTVARDQTEALIAALARHENVREHYYAVRGIHPDRLPPIERAARTLYLNRTCFNGIYRVNGKGLFNVPYGKQEHTTFFHPEALRQAAVALAGVHVSCCDFARATERARSGDFVYLDPPYVAGLRGGQGFTRYQSAGFREDDERRLAELVRALDRRGCFVMLSSADTKATRALYRGFLIESLTVRRQVGGHVGRRGKAGEIVVRNYGNDARRPGR
jgi:DNA adenine methylase